MSRACQHKTEPYEPKKIEAIYNNIVAKALTEKPQFYEIKVDGFTVVEKTSNPERFFDYSDFMDSGSKELAFFLFFGKGSDKFYFTLNGNTNSSQGLNGLSGNELKQENEDAVKERWRKDLHYEDLIEENEALKEEIEELRRSLELAEEDKDNIKHNRDINLNGVASIVLNGLLNTDLAKEKLGFLNNLSGTPPQTGEQEQSETENSFKRKTNKREEPEDVDSEEIPQPKLSKEEQEYIQLLSDIKYRVGLIELKSVFHLLDLVTVHPQSIRFAIKQVNNYLKQSPEYKQTNQSAFKETSGSATTTQTPNNTQHLTPFRNTITELSNNTNQSETQTDIENPIDLEEEPEL